MRRRLLPTWTATLAVLQIVLFAVTAAAQQETPANSSPTGTSVIPLSSGVGGFGGPASVPAQVEEQRVDGPRYRLPGYDRLFEPWMNCKNELNEACRLQVGMDYNSLYQSATTSLTGNDAAASGIYRVYTDWTLFGETDKTSGSLIFKAEHRHRYSTAITPTQLGFEAGHLGIPGVLFNGKGAAVSNLYWEQFLLDGQAGFVIGFLEPDSFVDVLGYANPWTTFQNFSIVVNPTIPFPDPVFGAAAGVVANDQWLFKGGAYDTNNTFDDFNFFPDGGEFLSHFEISWSPTRAERYLREIHVTGWHSDRRRQAGVPESHGVAVGGNWTFVDRWMIFGRAGWADGGAPLMHRALTGGVLRYSARRGDLTGIACTWEDPANKTLREQNSFEFFHRFQMAKNLAITPSMQVLVDPAQNLNVNAIAIFGLRVRSTF